jgi:acyl-CoA synthetase (AMP-forming)/AMP-acid ligase II
MPIVDLDRRHRLDDNAELRGCRVLLKITDQMDRAHALAALWRLGAVAVPIDPEMPSTLRSRIERHADAHVSFDGRELTVLNLDAEQNPADDRLILYTSGSTGRRRSRRVCC